MTGPTDLSPDSVCPKEEKQIVVLMLLKGANFSLFPKNDVKKNPTKPVDSAKHGG